MMPTRWNIAVSDETDQSLRLYLAGQGRARKGELSLFIEDAVRTRLFNLAAEQAKAANAEVEEDDLVGAVAEAVRWARES